MPDPLTCSQEGFPASHFPWPDDSAPPTMTAISGRNLLGLFPPSGLVGSVWKMCLVSSIWRVGLRGYTLTWKRKGTRFKRELFLLRLSAPRTAESASGSLPTPAATPRPNEGNVRILRQAPLAGEMTEEEAAAMLGKSVWEAQGKIPVMLPTPNSAKAANDISLTSSGDGDHRPNKLGWAVAEQMFPTPDAGMVAGSRTLPEGTSTTGITPEGKKRQVGLPNAVKLWGTPAASFYKGSGPVGSASHAHRDARGYLDAQVLTAEAQEREAMLPTPRAIYGEHPGMTDPRHLTGAAMLPTPRHEGYDAGGHQGAADSLHARIKQEHAPNLQLCAAWVSRLMGFPDGWLDVDPPTSPRAGTETP